VSIVLAFKVVSGRNRFSNASISKEEIQQNNHTDPSTQNKDDKINDGR